jgi:hypothetical protein
MSWNSLPENQKVYFNGITTFIFCWQGYSFLDYRISGILVVSAPAVCFDFPSLNKNPVYLLKMRTSLPTLGYLATLLISVTKAQDVSTSASAALPDLFACITKVFASTGDASKRLITPSNELYTDSRTGEKIKYVNLSN